MYERIQGVCAAGVADYMFNLASAMANGTVHDDVRDCLTDLRALCAFNPDGTHRPLSMPEAETRIFLGAVATQKKPALNAWYMSPLPEDVAAKDLRIGSPPPEPPWRSPLLSCAQPQEQPTPRAPRVCLRHHRHRPGHHRGRAAAGQHPHQHRLLPARLPEAS